MCFSSLQTPVYPELLNVLCQEVPVYSLAGYREGFAMFSYSAPGVQKPRVPGRRGH